MKKFKKTIKTEILTVLLYTLRSCHDKFNKNNDKFRKFGCSLLCNIIHFNEEVDIQLILAELTQILCKENYEKLDYFHLYDKLEMKNYNLYPSNEDSK